MTFNFDFQWTSLVVFLILMSIVIYRHKKKLEIQKMIFPVLYAGLFRTGFGLKFMENFSKKQKELVKFLGLCGIGFGFAGMIFMFVSLIQTVVMIVKTPTMGSGVALILPQTNIPGIGFLPFWYWLIALFVIVLIHEFSHGIVAKANGVKIKNSGLGFFAFFIPIVPLAFVEPDEKAMREAPDHVKYSVFAAGPFSNLLTALVVLLMFMVFFLPMDSVLTEKDGLSFSSINESYPSAILPENFTLRELNGDEIVDLSSFVSKMQLVGPGDSLMLGDGTNSYNLTVTVNPDDENKAFIGVTNFVNEVKIRDGVNVIFYNIYKWFRDLIKIIGIFSFLIGLVNLLPLGPVDGGQMVSTLFKRIFKNEKTAQKRFVQISLITLLLILLSMFYPALLDLARSIF
ncbi:site-2 protease family protein [Candidatus Woesearchaeota archaeon]|nr:site-2 protease family protein [Candidatus Woesearchaeota archaeon]